MSRFSDEIFIGTSSFLKQTLLVDVRLVNILEDYALKNGCSLSESLNQLLLKEVIQNEQTSPHQ